MTTTDVTRTYLEMNSPPGPGGGVRRATRHPARAGGVGARLALALSLLRGGAALALAGPAGVDRRGDQGLSRRADHALAAHRSGGAPAGYFELKRCDDGSVEIAYFGLLPDFVGKGLGKYLLVRAIEEAWALAPSRVWLHTCTLDHPAALPNYLARGFKATKTERYTVEA